MYKRVRIYVYMQICSNDYKGSSRTGCCGSGVISGDDIDIDVDDVYVSLCRFRQVP